MYDPDQISLRKHIEYDLERLENSSICKRCEGRGTILEKFQCGVHPNQSWKVYDLHYRKIHISICMECFGNGIVLPEKNRKKIYPYDECVVTPNQVGDFVCRVCGETLVDWDLDWQNGEPVMFSTCDDIKYVAKPVLMKIDIS